MNPPPDAHTTGGLAGKRTLEFDASNNPLHKKQRTSMDRDAAADPYQTILRRLSGMNDFGQHSMGREKMEALMAGLNESADDSQQLGCLTELCNFLSISTEDTISGFRSDAFAPLLVQCMRREHNIDIMLLAARALTHMMEALPTSCNTIVAAGAIPVFCEKLLAIEFIDLAEQCLSALEKLSQEHAHILLKEGALNAMLSFIDFFGISIQRKVVHTAANLCKRIPKNCFPMIQDTLPTMTNFLTYDDSKLVENAVLCISRLVSSFSDDEEKLQIILSDRLVANLIDLLGSKRGGGGAGDTRNDIGPATATMILRTLGIAARASLALTSLMLDSGLVPLLAELLAASTAPALDPERCQSGQSPGGTTFMSPGFGGSPTGASDPQGSPTQSTLSQKMSKASSASAEIIHETVTLFNDLLPPIQDGILSDILAARRPVGRCLPVRDCPFGLSDGDEVPAGARMTPLHSHPVASSKLESAWVCDAPGECLRGLKRSSPGSHAGIPRWRCIAGCDWDICDRCLAFHCGRGEEEDNEEEEEDAMDTDHKKSKKEKEKERKEREKKEKAKRQQKDGKKDKKEKEKEKEREREKEKEKERASKAEVREPGQPSARELMYREHPENLQRIAENMQAVMQVYSSTMHSSIKAKCLAILAKVVHFLPSDPLRELLRNIPISGFLAALLHTADVHALASALHMAQVLMDKLPDIFQVHFIREGVVNEIAILASKHDTPQGGSRPLSNAALMAQLVSNAKGFASKYFGHVTESTEDEGSDMLCSEVARRLHQIAEGLEAFTTKTDKEQEEDLKELCSVLMSEESVSTYEVLTSGIIHALLHYLTNKGNITNVCDRYERAGRFIKVLGQPCAVAPTDEAGGASSQPQDVNRGSYLQVLVQKLQAALSQEENFPIYVNDYAENNMTSSTLNCLKMLMQPFKLTLILDKGDRAEGEAPKEESRGTTVMVEPLATVGAVEDFIQTKLLATSTGESPGMKQSDEEMDGEEEDFPEEQETKEIEPPKRMTRSQTRMEKERAEKEKAKEKEKEKGKERPGTPTEHSDKEENDSSQAPKEKSPEAQDEELKEEVNMEVADDKDTSKDKEQDKEQDKEKEKEKESAEADKGKGKEKEESNAASSSSAQSSQQPKVVLRMGNTALVSGMTIFQCIHKYGNWRSPAEKQSSDNAAHLTSRRMWDVCHTLHYSVADESGAGSPKKASVPSAEGEASATEMEGTAEAEKAEGLYAGLITEGIVNIEHAMDDTMEQLMLDLGYSITPTTRQLLLLLRTLYAVNSNYTALLTFLSTVEEEKTGAIATELIAFYPLHDSEFISSKLTNKLLCQVHDPLLLCSGYLSASWCQALAVECPFLFSFATRRTFFELSSFGATRAMLMLQERFAEQGEPAQFRFGRIQKQKIRLSRAHILESAMKVMTLYGSQKAFLEFEFFGEVGTGLGPTLEFYTLVSKALQASKLGMWRNEAEGSKKEEPVKEASLEETESMDVDEKVLEEEEEYVFSPNGLFPAALNPEEPSTPDMLRLFIFLGEFMGRAMVDKRIIDIPLSIPFLKTLRSQPLCIDDIKYVRPELHAFLMKALALVRQKQRLEASLASDPEELKKQISALTLDGAMVEDLCLDFTLPGYEDIPLKPNGKNITVTCWNLEEYVDLVVEVMLKTSIGPQMAAFRKGFNSIFPIRQMQLFSIQEMDEMFCGSTQPITLEQLEAFTVCDHGYTHNSRAIRFLFSIITSMSPSDLRQFILFITGAPRLPVGGLKSLKPPLTVVRKTPDPSFDVPWKVADALPSVMTCANYLKLPDYASEETMREKLYLAMMEGQQSFHLS